MCCPRDKVFLIEVEELPEPLRSKILGLHLSPENFLNNSIKYRTLFQMTSFDKKQTVEGNFMPTFKIKSHVLNIQIYYYKLYEAR